MRLAGRVAVITGSGSGIGRASALAFAREGATVICVDWNEDANQETVAAISNQGETAQAIRADIGNERDVQELAKAVSQDHDRVDVLFNNAGLLDWASIEESTLETWERNVRVNLTGTFLVTKALLPLLKKSDRGSIINNGSIDGLHGNPGVAAYSAAKGGLIPLTHVMAYEFGKHNVRVNCIAPGGISTGLLENIPEGVAERVTGKTPLGRFGTAEEVAAAAVFFASDESSYISGATLVIDGGRTGITPGTAA